MLDCMLGLATGVECFTLVWWGYIKLWFAFICSLPHFGPPSRFGPLQLRALRTHS